MDRIFLNKFPIHGFGNSFIISPEYLRKDFAFSILLEEIVKPFLLRHNAYGQSIIHSQKASRGDASACFSKHAVYFLANFRYDISKKVVTV